MRAGWVAAIWLSLCLSVWLSTAAHAAPPAQIGEYRLEPTARGLEVCGPDGGHAAMALLAGGLAFAAVNALRSRSGGGLPRARIVFGLGVAAVGGVALLFGGTRWIASTDALLEQRRFAGELRTPRAALEAVEVVKAQPTGADVKGAVPPRLFEVVVRGRNGAVTRMRVESGDEATALASELATALGLPLR